MSVRFRQLASCCALTLLVLGAAASFARADDNDDNAYKFKGAAPDEQPDYEFHPIKPANPHTIYLEYDYPKFSGYIMYAPSYFNVSQNLQFGSSLPQFSTSGFSPVGFTLKGDLEVSALFGMAVTANYSLYSASTTSLGIFQLNQSTASVFTLGAEPYYSFHPGGSLLKISVGPNFGIDSFPVINFASGSNSSLVLTSYSSFILGPHVKLTYPFSGNVTGFMNAGFDFAPLHNGTNNGIHNNSQTIWTGEVGMETPLNLKTQFLASFLFEDKSSNFGQVANAGTFTWSANTYIYVLNLGVHYDF